MPRNFDASSVARRAQGRANYLGNVVKEDFLGWGKRVYSSVRTSSYTDSSRGLRDEGAAFVTLADIKKIRETEFKPVISNTTSNTDKPPPKPIDKPLIGSMLFSQGSSLVYPFDPDFNLDNSEFTFETWCKPSGTMNGELANLFSIGSQTLGNQLIGIAFDTTTSFIMLLFSDRDPINTRIAWTPDVWQHIAICGFPSLQVVYVFYNGAFSYQFFDLNPFILDQVNQELMIGSGFIGEITDFRFVIGLGIHAADFTPIYNELDTTPEKTVLLLLSETAATLAKDSSGLNKVGVLTGVSWSEDVPHSS